MNLFRENIHWLFMPLFLCCHSIFAQTSNLPHSLLEGIAYYESVDSFDTRYRLVKQYEDSLKKQKLYTQLRNTDGLYNFLPKSSIDSTQFRYYLKFHAFNIKKYLGQYDIALLYYEKAHEFVVDKELLDEHCVHVEGEIGNIYARRNDYNKAKLYLTSIIPYLKNVENFGRLSRLCSDIGNVYKWLDDDDQMKYYYNEGIQYSKSSQEYRGLQSNYAGLADYHINYVSSSNYDHELIKKYLDGSKQAILDNPNSDSYRDLRLMNVEEMWSQYYLSIDALDAALEKSLVSNQLVKQVYQRTTSREIAKSNYGVASIYLKMDEVEKSEAYVDSAFHYLIPDADIGPFPNADQIYDENTFTDLLVLKGQIYKSKYIRTKDDAYIDSMLLSINLAFDANDGLENYLTMQESKLISAGQNKQMVVQALDAYTMYANANVPYSINAVRKLFDRSKSRILAENQRRSKSLYKLSNDNKEKLLLLENNLLEVLSSPSDDMSLKEEYFIRGKIDSLKNVQSNTAIAVEYIREPYIEYVESDSSYYLFTNIGESRFIRIDQKARIDSLIEVVEHSLHNQSHDNLDLTLNKLCDVLLPIDISQIEILNVIPDGRLSYFSFDLLMIGEDYLIEKIPICYQQTALQLENSGRSYSSRNSILCLSPKYEGSQKVDPLLATRGGLSQLQFAQQEIDGIEEVFPGRVEQFDVLRFEELNQQLKNANIFHYAGHAVARNDSAFLIQLFDNQEELLLDKQIYEMSNQLELVTLSACETGLGTYHAGEGVSSLATSFLNSGTKSIVYSLWNANDVSTASIMKDFYALLESGKKKSIALRTAKLNYLTSASPEARHPYYWAAFSLVGNNRSIKNNFNRRIFIAGIALLVLVVFYLFFQNKNQNK